MPKPPSSTSETRADSPTTNDLLGYKRFVEPIAWRIANATEQTTPLTIGVYGEWGSGKISFLKMIDEVLKKQDIYPIWFNAWKYGQEDNLWSALIQTILEQARVRGRWYRRLWVKLKIWRDSIDLRSSTLEIVRRIAPVILRIFLVCISLLIVFGRSSSEIQTFLTQLASKWFPFNPIVQFFLQANVVKAIVAVIGFLATKPEQLFKLFSVKLGIDFSKFSHSASYRAHIAFLDEFSEEFKRIIKLVGNGKPIVVIIDDVDRCLPEKAIRVLEAIKLFLDAEGCIFLLAVDRDVVEKAIAVKYKDLLTMAKEAYFRPQQLSVLLGENYFEKIVQLPFSLPPISDEQITDFIAKVYPDNDIQMCSRIFTEGSPHNPRKVKRLLQTFLFLRDSAIDDIKNGSIKPSLVAKMVVIQSQFRQVYEDIATTPALLAELEGFCRRQAIPTDPNQPSDVAIDPILRERIKSLITQYPSLRKVLLQKVAGDDSFAGVNLALYIFLIKPVVETKPVSETLTKESPGVGQYLRQVVTEVQLQTLGGVLSATESQPNTEGLFVETALNEVGKDGERVSVSDILRKYARFVILGVAGSGKTTLLQYLSLIFARNFSQDDPNFLVNRLGVLGKLLPILIPLQVYGQYTEQNRTKLPTPADFLEFLDNYFSQRNIGLPTGFFPEYFERGNCILMLDGLDEVGPRTRQFVMQGIAAIASRYPTVRLIVTSRPAGYPGVRLEGFAHCAIMGFDDESVSRFVHQWAATISDDPEKAKHTSESLLHIISTYPDLKALAQNPLFLHVISTLYWNRGAIPQNRADFYEESLDLLLERWEASKVGIKSETAQLSRMEKRNLLATLAFSAEESSRSNFDETFVISIFTNELAKKGTSQIEALRLSENLIRTFQERVGILIEVGPGVYSFAHRIFQEYLAAIALTQSQDFIESVLQKHKNRAWEEIIRLAVARAGRTSPKSAENVMSALIESQTPEGVLLSGRCLLDIPAMNTDLRGQVIKSLNELYAAANVMQELQAQAKAILKDLGETQ